MNRKMNVKFKSIIYLKVYRHGSCQTICPPKQPDTNNLCIGENFVLTTLFECELYVAISCSCCGFDVIPFDPDTGAQLDNSSQVGEKARSRMPCPKGEQMIRPSEEKQISLI